MDTVLFNDVCLFKNNKTIIYGQYLNVKPSIKTNSSLNFNVPFEGFKKPRIRSTKVVFPAPDGPISPMKSPLLISKFTL